MSNMLMQEQNLCYDKELQRFLELILQVRRWLRRTLAFWQDEGEIALIKLLAQFPRIVEAAALSHEPHRIAFYLHDLAAACTPTGLAAKIGHNYDFLMKSGQI